MPKTHARRLALCAGSAAASVGLLALGACGRAAPAPQARTATATAFYATPFPKQPDAATLTALGRTLFFDTTLSASGRQSCASCHAPDHGYAAPNRLPVQRGGADLQVPGLRAVPSLAYAQTTPPFDEHTRDNDGDDSIDQGPAGGYAWDGRARSAHEQAQAPLLSPFEMGNADAAAAVARLAASPSAPAFRAAFGNAVFDDAAIAWRGLLLAFEVFEQSPPDFAPYSSKYDAVLRGRATLTEAEAHGLAVFNDPAKGNCAVCHPSAIKRGAFPQFTDRGFVALGVPRNPAIDANRDPAWHDLGLCGPLRTDLKDRAEYCGLFKTPTLRNVALRGTYFHNGRYATLEDAVRFYAQRDTHPERVYPRDGHGRVQTFDDLPAAYRDNVNREPPFGRRPGQPDALTAAEIADVVAFLKTLTDGWQPPAGGG